MRQRNVEILAATVFLLALCFTVYAVILVIAGLDKVREEQQTARVEACLAAGGMVLDDAKGCRLD